MEINEKNNQQSMNHVQKEFNLLRNSLSEMFALVIQQLEKTKQALLSFDKELAHEIIHNEHYINSFELKIDKDCENIIALYNPVAIDLRLVLATLKINLNLERIGDLAEGISHFIIDVDAPFNEELINKSKILEMYDIAQDMLIDVHDALDREDTKLARSVFIKDIELDKINKKAATIISEFIKQHPEQLIQSLNVLSMIRKLERVGDQVKNIAEEIIFYIEAKVLKHNLKKNGD